MAATLTVQEIPDHLLYSSLEQRKRNREILYYEIFKWKMKYAPNDVHHFCDVSLDEQVRRVLNSWIRLVKVSRFISRRKRAGIFCLGEVNQQVKTCLVFLANYNRHF